MSWFDLILQSILAGLVTPFVVLPAIVIGLLARRWLHVIIAVILLCAILLVASRSRVPSDATVEWWFTPIGVIAPLAWASVTFVLRRWFSRQRSAGVRRTVGVVLGLLLGAIGGAAVGVGVGVIAVEVLNVSSFEGASGYLVFLAFMPIGAIVGACAGAALGWYFAVPRKKP